MAKISIILALALVAVASAAPQSVQQPRQVVPGPAPVNGEQRVAPANPQQAKDLETAGSIGYGYYGGYGGYPYGGYSSSLYYGGYPSLGYGYGYGYSGYPYYTRSLGGLYGGYWY